MPNAVPSEAIFPVKFGFFTPKGNKFGETLSLDLKIVNGSEEAVQEMEVEIFRLAVLLRE